MSKISTHILDTNKGLPAAGITVSLYRGPAEGSSLICSCTTNEDGRIDNFLNPDETLKTESYRLEFETASYFAAQGQPVFYPKVIVEFFVQDKDRPHHVPLLLSSFGYSTYRGS